MAKKLMDIMKLKPETETRSEPKNEIAIIGIGLDLPLARDVETFWEQLVSGKGATRELPYNRKMEAERYAEFKHMDRSDWQFIKQGYLRSIDRFDYRFFGLSPREAELMDPHQRLFMQIAWHAFEDAGYTTQLLKGSRTGVFVGYDNEAYSYSNRVLEVIPAAYKEAHVGNLVSMIPGRVSNYFDLKGPSMIVNTSCSSSLVAIHNAVRSMLNGECDMALAGGIRLDIFPIDIVGKVGIESLSGKTRTFDDKADGTVTGEGMGAILLKPLRQALKDNDPIYAVIKGSAVNQDGRSIGLTAPNVHSQEEVLVRAWQEAGVDPETLSYLEAHGTGTKLGDPIELEAINKAFSRFTNRKQFCAIGTVKPNVGHLIGSAGVAGLIRAIMAMRHQIIPPTLYFDRPNRAISFEESAVYVNDISRDWVTDGSPRRCGVSSFGFSGTNCHIVLEEAPKHLDTTQLASSQNHVLTLSAKSITALHERIAQMVDYLSQQEQVRLEDICYTANAARSHFTYRVVFIAESKQELLHDLRSIGVDELKSVIPGTALVTGTDRQMDESIRWICDTFARGEEADWSSMYVEKANTRVRLPLYPFEPERCWIDSPQSQPIPFWKLDWESIPLLPPQEQGRLHKRCLLIHDEGITAERLADAIRTGAKSFIEVLPGRSFSKESETVFRLDFASPDYKELFRQVELEKLEQIVFMHQLNPTVERLTAKRLEKSMNEGLFHMLELCKEIAKHRGRSPEIVIITADSYTLNGQDSCIFPENRLIHTFGSMIPQESPNLNIRIIDLDASIAPSDIISELATAEVPKLIALRRGLRYVQVGQMIHEKPFGEIPLKAGGVYVITGGGGGIGQELAKYLADQKPLHVALISRMTPPDEQTLTEIKASGSTVSLHNADVCSYDELHMALADIRSGFGSIHGIIHCAGVASQIRGHLLNKERSFIRTSMDAKVFGTLLLDDLTQEDPLDFFFCSSSISALVGLPGEIEYSLSNAFLDAFCEERNLRLSGTKCMNWPAWNETGMAVAMGANLSGGVLESISNTEAMDAFSRLLLSESCRVIIGKPTSGGERFAQLITGQLTLADYYEKQDTDLSNGATTPLAVSERPQIILHGKEEEYTETEMQIAEAWREVLGYSSFHTQDNFFDIGGNSIMILKVMSFVNLHYPGIAQLSDLFAYPTISKLALFIDDRCRDSSADQEQPAPADDFSRTEDEEIEDLINRLSSGDLSVTSAMSHLTQERKGDGNE